RLFVPADHQHLERLAAHEDHARGRDRRHLSHCLHCQPTHSSPPGPRSFFQIGTVFLMRSIIARQASNDSARCGEAQTMAIEVSPTTRWPRRWTTAMATSGNAAWTPSITFAISFSAIGRYAS